MIDNAVEATKMAPAVLGEEVNSGSKQWMQSAKACCDGDELQHLDASSTGISFGEALQDARQLGA